MGLREKSLENKIVAERCLKWKAYNAGASRVYYSAFQMAKHYLKSKKFDYKSFLVKYPNFSGERDYSHGSLQCALFEFFQNNGKKCDMKKVNVIDNLYRKRRTADYTDERIIEYELQFCIEQLNLFLSIFE